MAELARRGKSSGLVRGVIRARIFLLMARVTESAIQRVIVVNVAIGAGARWHQMRTGQLETSTGVVEGTIRPLHGVMAGFACRRKCYGDVVYRRDGILVIRLMARVARGARQVVVVVGVAIGTLARRDQVRASQWETCAVMVESGIQPGGRVVALLAALREV